MASRGKRTPAPPPEAARFASLNDCDDLPHQCIAHTQQPGKLRCTLPLVDQDRAQASCFRRLAESLPAGRERDDNISQFILLHCCRKWHHDKLERDDTGCLGELVKAYGADIPMSETQLACPIDGELVADSNVTITTVGQPEPGAASNKLSRDESITTASKLETLIQSPAKIQIELDYFVPYSPSPTESIYKELLRNVPRYYSSTGELYSFTCPDYTGFVKVGFGKTATDRLRSWQLCDSGASLSKSITVSYPQRIERLIHLQLMQYRFKIPKCKAPDCGRTHVEWFKLSTTEVNQVISDWAVLTTRAPLYGPDRKLKAEWIKRIKRLAGSITARRLLDVLDAETSVKVQGEGTKHGGIPMTAAASRELGDPLMQDHKPISDEFDWDECDDTVVDDILQQLEDMSLIEKKVPNNSEATIILSEMSNVKHTDQTPKHCSSFTSATASSMLPTVAKIVTTPKQQDDVLEMFESLAIQAVQHIVEPETQPAMTNDSSLALKEQASAFLPVVSA